MQLLNQIDVNGRAHLVFNYRDIANSALDGTLRSYSGLRGQTFNGGSDSTATIRRGIQESLGIPQNIRDAAEQHSARLRAVLEKFSPVLRRDLSHGALDSSKLARLASPGLSAREFDSLANRAYRRREPITRQRQMKIAVVGDFNFNIRMRDKSYAPRMSQLVHTITDACVIAGIPCAAYGVRGNLTRMTLNTAHVPAHVPASATAILKDYGDEMNGATFALLNSEILFSGAYGVVMKSQGHGGCGSINGTGGIEYAAAHGAEFIIGVGNFEDSIRPNVHLAPGVPLADAIEAIATELDAVSLDVAA